MTLKNLDQIQLKRTIDQMAIGETGFIIPWALLIDRKTGDAYLEKDMSVESESGGTVEMQVTRLSPTDYEVDCSCITHWTFLDGRLQPPNPNDLIKIGNIRSYLTNQAKENLR